MSKEEENKDSESVALEPSARAIRLAQTHVLAKVRWRYRPEGFVLAKKGVQVHDILVVTSDFLDTDAVEVIAIRPLTPEQADRPGFEEAVNHQAHCASEDEIRKRNNNLTEERQIAQRTQRESDQRGVGMTVRGAYLSLDRKKVLITYTADGKVDFRELLKILGAAFHMKIEFCQLYPRDYAQVVGGLGVCGLPLCCNAFLSSFKTITLSMAKTQNLSLNIAKLSGQCGRLMCCLAYENDLYAEIRTKFPSSNSFALVGKRIFKVVSVNMLSDSIVATDGDTYENFTAEEWMKLPASTKLEFNAQKAERKHNE